jgi:hypothetical protein
MQTELASDQWEGRGGEERRGSWPWTCAKSGRDLRLRLCLSWPPARPSAVICSPFAEEIAPCAPAAAAATDHTEKEGQRDLDIPYPIHPDILTIIISLRSHPHSHTQSSTILGAPLSPLLSSSFLPPQPSSSLFSPSRPKKGTLIARNTRKDGARFRRHRHSHLGRTIITPLPRPIFSRTRQRCQQWLFLRYRFETGSQGCRP